MTLPSLARKRNPRPIRKVRPPQILYSVIFISHTVVLTSILDVLDGAMDAKAMKIDSKYIVD